MCVRVLEREACLCVRVRVFVCLCMREREREREGEGERERESVCVRERVCVGARGGGGGKSVTFVNEFCLFVYMYVTKRKKMRVYVRVFECVSLRPHEGGGDISVAFFNHSACVCARVCAGCVRESVREKLCVKECVRVEVAAILPRHFSMTSVCVCMCGCERGKYCVFHCVCARMETRTLVVHVYVCMCSHA